jgi:hypothetical protein
MRSLILAVVATAFLASPALAHYCPKDAAAIDAYLAREKVDDKLKAEVVALKDKGMAEHTAGNHTEAEATLAEAMRKLLMGQ